MIFPVKNRKARAAFGGGFTLLEVIMAIFVLTVGVGGSFALISQTIATSSLNKSRLSAFYLAQEGVEIARNIRDSNWLAQGTDPVHSWKAGLDAGSHEAAYTDSSLGADLDRPLLLDSANGFYSYSGGIPTMFKRQIIISETSQDAIGVEVRVSWSEKGVTHSVKATERLYNWYGN